MEITLNVNGKQHTVEVSANTSLLDALRDLGYTSVKRGCNDGTCGACSVLLDGKPVYSCSLLAAQAAGHTIQTVDALGGQETGWDFNLDLHPLQEAFVEVGAIQCGFCTPAMLLTAKHLLDENPDPTEKEVREALSGVVCRCTGYEKPVKAVLLAAARMRGDEEKARKFAAEAMPEVYAVPQVENYRRVGKPERKVDALKLVQGKPAFTEDFEMPGMLIAKVLRSPVAHARIKRIDTSKAKALPGVHAVLTWKDIPRVVYATAGQSDPIPGPLDTFSLDNKVRFVGDRVAFVAAETEEIAEQALKLIEVEYEELPAIVDPEDALKEDAPIIHDEPEYVNFGESDPSKNVAARIRIDIGDVEKGFKEADFIFEGEYEVPRAHQAYTEPHVAITYWDENDRLVIRTSTQVPFHVRRQLAPVLNLPIKKIRVVKPRIGGGFGGKQEVLVEDVPAHLTIVTGRPVKYVYTDEEEFTAARPRHAMKIRLKTGVKKDGTITANEMYALSNTGAYGGHALTVAGNTGHKAMALYVGDGEYRKHPNIRFYADTVYTNTVPSGAYRGYGATQGFFAVERHMEKIAHALGMDPIEFRLKNAIRPGEYHPFSLAWNEGREPSPETIETNALAEAVAKAREAVKWDEKYNNPEWQQVPGKPHLRRGIGLALLMQGTAIAKLDMGGAFIKMNEDGSFNMMVGAADLGTGSDTVLAQMAAEVLGVPLDDIIVVSGDTDFTPFDKGAYASSTTYVSGAAATKAAEQVAERIRARAAAMLNARGDGPEVSPDDIVLADRKATAPDGRSVTFAEIGFNSIHHENQEQIMGAASFMAPASPPPFAVQVAEVTVDAETGQVWVDALTTVADAGVVINPLTASGQVEGGVNQGLGYGIVEEMPYTPEGQPLVRSFRDYHVPLAPEMPRLKTIFVETFEATHPFGVKSVSEYPLNGVAPAVANAVYNALGASVESGPVTPEKVWRAKKAQK